MRPSAALILALATATPALAAERAFPTGQFDRVANTTPFDVYVHTGHAPSAHATGSDKAIDRLQIDNRGGELIVGTKPGHWTDWGWHGSEHMRVDITVPMVRGVRLSGPGNLNVDTVHTRAFSADLSGPGNIAVGMIGAEATDLHLSGPGDLTVSGQTGHATYSVSGPGNIHGTRFSARDATVSLSGPGDIDATVTGTADVHLSGPGNVRIRGGARCAIHKSGPGDVTCG